MINIIGSNYPGFQFNNDPPAQICFNYNFKEFMQRERHLLNLVQLRKEHEKDISLGKENNDKLYSSIGLVVDCSNVYKYEANRDFTQKFKIIDSTSQNQTLQVYIWSNRKEDFTLNIRVGDILFFNNFKIELYNGALQAKKVYKTDDSYYRIFSGNPQITNYSPIDKKVGLDDEDGKILTALGHLRTYSKTYFKNNKVPVLFKQEGKVKADPKKIASSDFDIILRVVESVDSANHFKLKLSNDKDEFHLNYTKYVEPGVYKIRSIADVKWEERFCSLSGNDYTFFLQISSWMKSYDPKEWDRLVCSPDAVKKKPKRIKFESKVVTSNKKIKKLTLKQLFSKDDHNEEVRVVCQVMDVCTPFDKALKKYDEQNHTQKSRQSETGRYIYSIHLLLSDQSLGGQVCNAYIYTYDGRGLQFLPQLHPDNIFGRNILNVKENYQNFVNRLVEESDINQAPVELVLSPLFNGKQTIYRIVESQLLF